MFINYLIYTFISALLLLYDVTNKVSFDNIRAWLSEIRDYANEQVVIMLIGKFQNELYTEIFFALFDRAFRFLKETKRIAVSTTGW